MSRRGTPMMFHLQRRKLLQGLGVAAIARPFLFPRVSQAQTRKRLVIFCTNNGTIMKELFPAPDGKYGRILAPLEKLRARTMVVRGLDMMASIKLSELPNHLSDNANLLTGISISAPGKMGGISVDQYVAGSPGFKGQTKFASVQLGVLVQSYAGLVSSAGVDQGLPPNNNPAGAFTTLFRDVVGGDPIGLQKVQAERKSILDVVRAEVQDLQGTLGGEPRRKLDAHLTAIRELERQLEFRPASCDKLQPPAAAVDYKSGANLPQLLRQQLDLAFNALACDRTRVITIQMSNGGNEYSYPFAGCPYAHHGMAHHFIGKEAVNGAVADEYMVKLNTWYAQQLAELLTKMDAVSEPGGTMLDNSLVVWANEQSYGANHNRSDMPWVLVGTAGGAFKSGRSINFGGVPQNRFLTTLANMMGAPARSFGDRRVASDLLPGVLG